ncbi:MAG: general secretion pathway protein GspB [Pseudomonadota bacterium]
MSLILDALKKSDAERSRRRAPEAAAALTPVANRGTRRWWIPIAILLAINAVGIGWLVGRSMSSPANAPVATTTSQLSAIETPAVDRSPATRPSLPAEAPTRKPRIERLSEQTLPVAQNVGASDTPVAVEVTDVVQSPAANAAPVVVEDTQTYANYVADTGNSFGDLSISLHVYDPSPVRRFAFVDGRKVTEGDRLANNLRVAEITAAGVVFAYAGDRFLVPRD